MYNYINSKLFLNINKLHLPYNKKDKLTKPKEKSIRKKGGRSIEERGEEINRQEEIGHWEMDTVVGKRETKSCLLVLTKRKSRLQIIRKLKNKTMIEVVKTVKEIIKSYPEAIKTITSDNGSEFMDAESIEQKGIKYFYAHSYCSEKEEVMKRIIN